MNVTNFHFAADYRGSSSALSVTNIIGPVFISDVSYAGEARFLMLGSSSNITLNNIAVHGGRDRRGVLEGAMIHCWAWNAAWRDERDGSITLNNVTVHDNDLSNSPRPYAAALYIYAMRNIVIRDSAFYNNIIGFGAGDEQQSGCVLIWEGRDLLVERTQFSRCVGRNAGALHMQMRSRNGVTRVHDARFVENEIVDRRPGSNSPRDGAALRVSPRNRFFVELLEFLG